VIFGLALGAAAHAGPAQDGLFGISGSNARGISGSNARGISGSNARGISGSNARGISGSNARGISGSNARGISGSNARGISGSNARGISGSNARGISGSNARGISGSNARGISGSNARGISGSNARGISGSNARGISGSNARGSSGSDGYEFGAGFGVAAMGALESISIEGSAGVLVIAGQSFSVARDEASLVTVGDYVVAAAAHAGSTAVVYHVNLPYVPGVSTVRVKGVVRSADVATGQLSVGSLAADYTPLLATSPTFSPAAGETIEAAGVQPALGGVLVVGSARLSAAAAEGQARE
jgi:hypothetical protein